MPTVITLFYFDNLSCVSSSSVFTPLRPDLNSSLSLRLLPEALVVPKSVFKEELGIPFFGVL